MWEWGCARKALASQRGKKRRGYKGEAVRTIQDRRSPGGWSDFPRFRDRASAQQRGQDHAARWSQRLPKKPSRKSPCEWDQKRDTRPFAAGTERAHFLTHKVRMTVTFLKGQEWGLSEELSLKCSAQCPAYSKCSKSINYYYFNGCVIIFSSGFQMCFCWFQQWNILPSKKPHVVEEGRPGLYGGGGSRPRACLAWPPSSPQGTSLEKGLPVLFRAGLAPAAPLGGPQRKAPWPGSTLLPLHLELSLVSEWPVHWTASLLSQFDRSQHACHSTKCQVINDQFFSFPNHQKCAPVLTTY